MSRELIIIGDLIIAEILRGFWSDNDYESAKFCLGAIPFHQLGSYHVAVLSALSHRILGKKGVPIRKTIDIIIGTYCIFEELPLGVSNHFDKIRVIEGDSGSGIGLIIEIPSRRAQPPQKFAKVMSI